MKHPDIDASLRAAEPLLESLDDGFSPPAETPSSECDRELSAHEPAAPRLSPKSPF